MGLRASSSLGAADAMAFRAFSSLGAADAMALRASTGLGAAEPAPHGTQDAGIRTRQHRGHRRQGHLMQNRGNGLKFVLFLHYHKLHMAVHGAVAANVNKET